MCDAACSAGGHHQAECLLLSGIRARLEPQVWAEQRGNIRDCLLTIRLATTQWRSEKHTFFYTSKIRTKTVDTRHYLLLWVFMAETRGDRIILRSNP